MPTPDRRSSLKVKLALWSVAAMVLVVLAVTSFALWVLRDDLSRSAADVQSALADSIARELDARITDRGNALSQSAGVLGPVGIDDLGLLREHFATRPVVQGMFDALIVADRSGTVVFDAPTLASRKGLSVADRDYFKQAVSTGRLAISRPLASKATSEPNIVFAVPLRNARGDTIGALCGILYLTRQNFLSDLGTVKIGKTGYVAVIEKGDAPVIVMHADRNRIMTPVPPPERSPLAHRALRGFEGTAEGVNSTGLDALFTFRALHSVPWVVTTVYPTAEAYAQIRSTERLVMVLGLALMLLAGMGIWLVVDRLLAPLERLRAAMVASRSRSEPTEVEARDETRELGEVVDAYNALMVHIREARAASQQSRDQLNLITDNVPAQIVSIDPDQRYTFANAQVGNDLRMAPAALIGRSVREVRGELLYEQIRGPLERALAGHANTFTGEGERDGRPAWYHAAYVPDFGPDGLVRGVFAMTLDVTPQKEAEALLAKSEVRLRMIADNLPVLIAYIDAEERMQFLNEMYRTWFDVDPIASVGQRVADVVGAEVYQSRSGHIHKALAGERVEFDLVTQTHGAPRFLRTVYVPDVREDGRVVGIYALSADITEVKQVEARLNEQARVDTLTGLPNRRAFDERLQESLSRNRRQRRRMALLFLDIDHFKQINDTHGHGVGDQVLMEFGKRLLSCVRRSDTVARLAGDEFVIILEGLNGIEEATAIANKIGQLMRLPFQVGDEIRRVTTSIGVAYVDGADVRPDDLVDKADGALYRAKRNGRNTFAVTTY